MINMPKAFPKEFRDGVGDFRPGKLRLSRRRLRLGTVDVVVGSAGRRCWASGPAVVDWRTGGYGSLHCPLWHIARAVVLGHNPGIGSRKRGGAGSWTRA